jgi:release factor glutamine methyltransferase
VTWLDAADQAVLLLSKQLPEQIARNEAWHLITRVAGTCLETVFPEHARSEVDPLTSSAIRHSLARLECGEPASYVVGTSTFLDVEVFVDDRVLIPRHETEVLVNITVDWLRQRNLQEPQIIDLGTGSGCVAKALCAAFPKAYVVCVDISSGALEVAARNLSKLRRRSSTMLVTGDWLSWLRPSALWDVIVCNPPYIASEDLHFLEPTVSQWEPHVALDGGTSGQRHIRAVLEQAVGHLAPSGLLALEMTEDQIPTAVEKVMKLNGIARWWAKEDLAGRPRFLLVEREGS